MSKRELALKEWLETQLPDPLTKMHVLCGDASFRRYYRAHSQTASYIVMDAPPNLEPITPFLEKAGVFKKCGIRIPEIFAINHNMGFILLEDFGDQLLLDIAPRTSMLPLYQNAVEQLIKIQQYSHYPDTVLAPFDSNFMLEEMELCIEWFLKKYLRYSISSTDSKMLHQAFSAIASQIETQAKALIHRDYHSRNIMVISQKTQTQTQLGIIDFQDAMLGPYTYDLVSLGKDCYIEWPRDTQLQWLSHFHQQHPSLHSHTFSKVVDDYDYCGLQRHLKVLGVFSRLHIRDGKNGYLENIPLTLKYILNCLEDRAWFPELLQFFQRISLA